MKKIQSLFIALILMFITVFSVYATEFKNIVVFGDSLSDNGNFFAVSGDVYPPAPYYQGRFSDGPVWFEYLAEDIGVTGIALNYAHGGAMTGDTNVSDAKFNSDFPGFADEIKAYVDMAAISLNYKAGFAMPKDTLFIIWIGSNDFWAITDPVAQITQAVSNIQNGITQLISAGATKFMVINLPDSGKTPKFVDNPSTGAAATQLISGFNNALEQVIVGIETVYPEIEIKRFNAFNILSEFLANAESLGFTNTTASKLNTSTGEVSDGIYMFWDEVHPTTFTHKLIAKKIAEAINCENCETNMMPYLENDLTLKVPSAKLGDYNFGFTLVPYLNPAEPNGIFWTLDLNSLEVK